MTTTPYRADERFTTLELIARHDCPNPDLLTFGGALIHKNVCISGNVTVDQDLIYSNAVIGEGVAGAFQWQVHARFNKNGADEGVIPLAGDPRSTNTFQNGILNPAHHVFNGAPGNYTVTIIVTGDSAAYEVGLLEVSLDALNAATLPPSVPQIATFSVPVGGLNYRHIVTATATATITPAMWYYFTNDINPITVYEVQVTQNV